VKRPAATNDPAIDIEERGFSAWPVGADFETVWAGMLTRPRAETENDRERTLADGRAMFADPVPSRARDLLDRTADWRPDIVVREIYELAGMYVLCLFRPFASSRSMWW
jgi:hypothetical protein